MLELYYWPTPNGKKVTILLEEVGLPYEIIPVNISRGDQFGEQFLKISPNNRMPALVDSDPPGGKGPVSIFESGAIMMYIAEKAGKFWPQDIRGKYEVTQWIMWQMANQGPKLGECGHFRRLGDREGDQSYAVRRFTDEANRLYGVLNNRLYDRRYLRRRIHHRRHDRLSLDHGMGSPGPEHRRVQIFQAMVRGTGRSPRREARNGGRQRPLQRQLETAGRRAGTDQEAALQPARPARPGGVTTALWNGRILRQLDDHAIAVEASAEELVRRPPEIEAEAPVVELAEALDHVRPVGVEIARPLLEGQEIAVSVVEDFDHLERRLGKLVEKVVQ